MSERQAATGEAIDFHGITITLGQPCGGEDGAHACATHSMIFPNNLTANGHVDQQGSQHVTFWHCYAHGPEAVK